jgi:3-isopropylmalate dehydrogenase
MKLLVLPCDGIGPEIISASMQVLETASSRFGLDLSFNYDDVGFVSLEKHGTTLRESVLDRARQDYDGVILGTQSHATRHRKRVGGTFRPGSASVSTSMPMSDPPARARSSPRT